MNIEVFVSTSAEMLKTILAQSGAVLYSSVETLCPGSLYILGLNPGGKTGQTIAECLQSLPRFRGNEYLDEDWSSDKRSYPKGGHPLQRHLAHLIGELGQDLRGICASNLIFTRSSDQYGADYLQNAGVCWPVHELILSIVRPSVLLVFGNGDISPYAYLRQRHFDSHRIVPEETKEDAQFRNWQCKAFRTTVGSISFLVLGLPHLSRYTIEGRPKVLKWIKEILPQQGTPSQKPAA